MIWTKDGEELANSRHVQLRERENKTTLQLINLKPSMAGEYRLVVISPLGSDLTFCQLSVTPLHREERQKLQQMQRTGLDQLIRSVRQRSSVMIFYLPRSEEEKIIEKKKKKLEKEEKLRQIKERNRNQPF